MTHLPPKARVDGTFTTLGAPRDRDPGISTPPRLRMITGCTCRHEDWEHSGFHDGCLIRGCHCPGWWKDLGVEL